MPPEIPRHAIHPPPDRPSWGAEGNLPLIYLGWGRRDFHTHPLAVHYDLGTHYFLLVSGSFELLSGNQVRSVRGPAMIVMDEDCPFGIRQKRPGTVEVLVWVWKGHSPTPALRPPSSDALVLRLRAGGLEEFRHLHRRCRREVSLADEALHTTLPALRGLLEAEILRSISSPAATPDVRWKLAHSWMTSHLALQAPVPALCEYLGMSPSTLHRFFCEKTGCAPGVYFRRLKRREARRLITTGGWQVKAAAYHLGYRHPNDLSRALREEKRSAQDELTCGGPGEVAQPHGGQTEHHTGHHIPARRDPGSFACQQKRLQAE